MTLLACLLERFRLAYFQLSDTALDAEQTIRFTSNVAIVVGVSPYLMAGLMSMATSAAGLSGISTGFPSLVFLPFAVLGVGSGIYLRLRRSRLGAAAVATTFAVAFGYLLRPEVGRVLEGHWPVNWPMLACAFLLAAQCRRTWAATARLRDLQVAEAREAF